MSICQTSPRLEKRPRAFCFLLSEERPANTTGFPKGTDPRNGNLSSGIPARCLLPVSFWYVDASLGILVRLTGVLRTPLLSFPWRCCRR